MIVLDASVLIAYLDADDAQHATAEALLVREVDDQLATNPLTLAEVLVAPTRDGRLEPVLAALRELEIESLPYPDDTASRLAKLRVDTGLKMPDCCVLLSAQGVGARVAAFDVRLGQAAEQHGLVVLRS